MPRVHKVEKARKAMPAQGIAVGDSYYWWKFKNRVGNGTRMVSKTPPKPSQLTRSGFNSQWRGFAEQIEELPLDDGLYDALQEIAGAIRELGEEAQSSLDNMPEGLQQGATGELLTQRVENADSWASEIEGLEQPELIEPEMDEPGQDEDESAEEYELRSAEAEQEHEDEVQRAQEDYDEALQTLKDDALAADPGEA